MDNIEQWQKDMLKWLTKFANSSPTDPNHNQFAWRNQAAGFRERLVNLTAVSKLSSDPAGKTFLDLYPPEDYDYLERDDGTWMPVRKEENSGG